MKGHSRKKILVSFLGILYQNNAINSEKKEQISPKLKNGSLYNNGLPEAKSLLEVKIFYVLESPL